MPRNVIIAIGVIFFGIIAFDMMGIIVRLLGDTYPILQIAAMRNFFGMIPALILLAILQVQIDADIQAIGRSGLDDLFVERTQLGAPRLQCRIGAIGIGNRTVERIGGIGGLRHGRPGQRQAAKQAGQQG